MSSQGVEIHGSESHGLAKDSQMNGELGDLIENVLDVDVEHEKGAVEDESEHSLIANCGKDDAVSNGLGQLDGQGIRPPTRLATIRKLCLSVYFNTFLCQSIRALVVAALPLHILDLGGDSSVVGATVSAYGLGFMLVNIPGGWLLSALGPKPVMLICCALFLVSAFAAILAEWASMLAMLSLGLSSFILGAGNSLSLLSQQTFIGAQVAAEHRGLALSTMAGLSRAGYAVAPFVAGVLTAKFGVISVFALQAILSLLLVVGVVLFMPGVTKDSDNSAPSGSSTGSQTAREVLSENSSTILRIMGFILALQTVRKARELFFALAGRDIGLSADLVGRLTALSYLFDMMGFPIAGRILDTCGRRPCGMLSLITQSIGILVLLHRTLEATFLSAMLTGIGNGLSSGIVMTIAQDLSPPGNARGPFLSVFRMLATSSELIVPASIGFLARSASLPTAELISSVIGLVGIVWIVACMPETLPPEKRSFACTCVCCSGWSSLPSEAKPEEVVVPTTIGRERVVS